MTSGCLKPPFRLLSLLIILSFHSRRAESHTTLSLSTGNNASTEAFTYPGTNSNFKTNLMTDSDFTALTTNNILAPTLNSTNAVSFITTIAPLSVAETDCFRINNVTHSSITITSKKPLTLTLDKCTGSHISFQKFLVVGIHTLTNLEACTSYHLRVGQECAAFVKTSHIAPEPATNFGASLSKETLNLTWHSNISTANCISHYEVVQHDSNRTTDYKAPGAAQYCVVSKPKSGKSYFSFTAVDVNEQKITSGVFEIIVRDSLAVVTNRTTSLTQYSKDIQPVYQRGVNLFSKAVARATDGLDPCYYKSPEEMVQGSQSVICRVNFTCSAYQCSVECCLRPGKCEPNPSESWKSSWSSNVGGGISIMVNGRKLSRRGMYFCTLQVTRGHKMYRKEFYLFTKDGRPRSPLRVRVTNITSYGFLVTWDPPPYIDLDPVDYYTVTVTPQQPNYRSRTSCAYPTTVKTYNASTRTFQDVAGLLPYFVYRVSVAAHNTYGSSDTVSEKFSTGTTEPGNCEDVQIIPPVGNTTLVDPVHIIKWAEPCRWNAFPRGTMIKIVGNRLDNPSRTSTFFDDFYNLTNSFVLNASRDFKYTIEIFARVVSAPEKLCAGPFYLTIPPGLSTVSSKWLKVRPDVLTSDDGGSPVVALPLHQNLLDDSNGTIKHIAIMVAQKGLQGPRERVFQPSPSWPSARSWYEAMTDDGVLMYQATPKQWCFPLFEDNNIHPYNLGSENCFTNESDRRRRWTEDDFENQDNLRGGRIVATSANATGLEGKAGVYCNGPLRKNIEYVVRLRVFTLAGYSDSDDIYFRTGHATPGWSPFYDHLWIYGIFPVFLVSVLLSTMWMRRQRRWTNVVASAPSPDMIESGSKRNRLPRRKSVSPQRLPVVAARLLVQKSTLEKEFEDLNEISAEWAAKVPCTVGLMKENRLKNRYADVVPYDYNRVKLSSESTSQTDYINASFIKGFSMDTEYIACQGPTVETSNDFWQMVFDQNVCFIVMLTSLVENGMAKCSQYFSELCENKEWMDFTVKCTSRLDLSNYTVRELQLYKRTNREKRFIQHFQFRDWPDFGCPRNIDGILEFCDVLRGNLCLSGDSKTVVHCSAGIGRTGTLIALDILLQFVHYNRKVDIMRTVLRLREQRQWMVRTADQYAFLYRCLKTAAERHFSPDS